MQVMCFRLSTITVRIDEAEVLLIIFCCLKKRKNITLVQYNNNGTGGIALF